MGIILIINCLELNYLFSFFLLITIANVLIFLSLYS